MKREPPDPRFGDADRLRRGLAEMIVQSASRGVADELEVGVERARGLLLAAVRLLDREF